MTKSSSFFENSRNPSINGGNFIHTETHSTQQKASVFHGPIYGYTHTAANEGPVIGYLHQVTIGSDHGHRGQPPSPGLYEPEHSKVPLISATHSDTVHDEPEPMTAADMRIGPRNAVDTGVGLTGTLALTALSLDYPLRPELDSLPPELNAEFMSLTPEMRRYISCLLSNQVVPAIGDTVEGRTRSAAHATRTSSQ